MVTSRYLFWYDLICWWDMITNKQQTNIMCVCRQTCLPLWVCICIKAITLSMPTCLCGFACLLFYALATSKLISGRVSTRDSAHSWPRFSATSVWNPSAPWPQSHYPDTERSSPSPILIKPRIWLGSHKYQFYVIGVFSAPCLRSHCKLLRLKL